MLEVELTPFSDTSFPPTPEKNYGVHGALIILSKDETESQLYPLNLDKENSKIYIGRHSSCNITIKVSTVSRRHAVIILEDNALYISPATTNGYTYLNGEVLTESVELYHGDIITIEGRNFKYEKYSDLETSKSGDSSKEIYTKEIMKKLFVENNTTVSLGGLSSDSEKSKKSLSNTISKEITEKVQTPPSSKKRKSLIKSPSSTLKRKSTGRKSISFAKKIERVCTFSKEERTLEIKRDVSPKTPEMGESKPTEDKRVNDLYILEEIKENLQKNIRKNQDDEMTLIIPTQRSPLKDVQLNQQEISNDSIHFVLEEIIEKPKREIPQFERELPENFKRYSLPEKTQPLKENQKRNSLEGSFKLIGKSPRSLKRKSISKTSPIIYPSPEILMEKPSNFIGTQVVPDFTPLLTTASPNPFKKSPYQKKSKDNFSMDSNEEGMLKKNLFAVPEKKTKTKVVSRKLRKKLEEEKKLKKMKNGIEVRSRKQKREEQALKKQKVETTLSKNIYKEVEEEKKEEKKETKTKIVQRKKKGKK